MACTQPIRRNPVGPDGADYSPPPRLRRLRAVGFLTLVVASLTLSCGDALPIARILPNEVADPISGERAELVARFVHISDAQIMDEESPGRLTAFAGLARSAWRPYEAFSIHLLDGMIRTVNKLHVADGPVDFLIHTGDALDNAQLNELRWFITAMDGGIIDPRTGPDDRSPAQKPDPSLDPHIPFTAQGLFQNGVHGALPTIPWYAVAGNHDRFASGTFLIIPDLLGRSTAPLPLDLRIGLTLPVVINPTGSIAWGAITPANPGPPPTVTFPETIPANEQRRFITQREFVDAHVNSRSLPIGHGFDGANPARTWYAATPVAGLRLIVLNSSTPFLPRPQVVYSEGAISWEQRRFLEAQLALAEERSEWVILATHHPSASLEWVYGTSLGPFTLRELLNNHPCVKLHLAGHTHVNSVIDRGGYVEVITGSILDPPQEGRLIEMWRVEGRLELRYRTFSHLEEIAPPSPEFNELFIDVLRDLRAVARKLADDEARSIENGKLIAPTR